MAIIYTNQDKTKFLYCNHAEKSITTIEKKPNGCFMSTIKGKEAEKKMQEYKFDLKYNFDNMAYQIASAADFAEAFLEVQRTLINSLNSINQSLYQKV